MAFKLASGACSQLLLWRAFTMALLRYKLPKQAAAAIPLDATCSIQAAEEFIETEHQITSAFKLRVCVGGTVHVQSRQCEVFGGHADTHAARAEREAALRL